MNQLFDFWEVSEVQLSGAGVRAFASSTSFSEKARRVLVVRQPVMYGLARMAQILTEDVVPDTVVQRDDLEPACEWLGVSANLPGIERPSSEAS